MNFNVSVVQSAQYDLKTIKESLNESFLLLGFDRKNPLGHIIKPGMNVFIKPNWVASRWRKSCAHKDELYCVITHPLVIEAVADYADLALDGKGSITIGDNPSIDADFEELMTFTGIAKLQEKYRTPCRIMDLRPLICKDLRDYGDQTKMHSQTGDIRGYTEVDIGEQSMLSGINERLIRGVFKQRDETIRSHHGETHLYTYSNSIYNSDVYISIPKMKTHHKVGTTLNVKGLVGTIGNKNQLVHWRNGFPLIGGDEYPSFAAWLKGCFSRTKSRGSWMGNDTIWRMVIDLYRGMNLKKRNYLSVVDGITGGQGNGPFCPRHKASHTLVVGEDMAAVDIATTRLMGFDPGKIPYLSYLIDNDRPFESIKVLADFIENNNFFKSESRYLEFDPPDKWGEISPFQGDVKW